MELVRSDCFKSHQELTLVTHVGFYSAVSMGFISFIQTFFGGGATLKLRKLVHNYCQQLVSINTLNRKKQQVSPCSKVKVKKTNKQNRVFFSFCHLTLFRAAMSNSVYILGQVQPTVDENFNNTSQFFCMMGLRNKSTNLQKKLC